MIEDMLQGFNSFKIRKILLSFILLLMNLKFDLKNCIYENANN